MQEKHKRSTQHISDLLNDVSVLEDQNDRIEIERTDRNEKNELAGLADDGIQISASKKFQNDKMNGGGLRNTQ